jgi:hypothetical protein
LQKEPKTTKVSVTKESTSDIPITEVESAIVETEVHAGAAGQNACGSIHHVEIEDANISEENAAQSQDNIQVAQPDVNCAEDVITTNKESEAFAMTKKQPVRGKQRKSALSRDSRDIYVPIGSVPLEEVLATAKQAAIQASVKRASNTPTKEAAAVEVNVDNIENVQPNAQKPESAQKISKTTRSKAAVKSKSPVETCIESKAIEVPERRSTRMKTRSAPVDERVILG